MLALDLIPEGTELREAVLELLHRKMSGEELDLEPRLEVINVYLEQQIAHFELAASQFRSMGGVADAALDELFRPRCWKYGEKTAAGLQAGKSKRILRRDQPYAFNHQGDRDRSRNALSSARQKSRWSGFMNACLLLWHWNLSRWIRGCKL